MRKREKSTQTSVKEVVDNKSIHTTIYIIFTSLLLDLLAFTVILPLLPSLLDHYRLHDSTHGLYPFLLDKIKYFQQLVGAPDRFNSVLFGGNEILVYTQHTDI